MHGNGEGQGELEAQRVGVAKNMREAEIELEAEKAKEAQRLENKSRGPKRPSMGCNAAPAEGPVSGLAIAPDVTQAVGDPERVVPRGGGPKPSDLCGYLVRLELGTHQSPQMAENKDNRHR